MTDDVHIPKEASCPSLSATSTITYQIGTTSDGTINIRLTGNSGNGYFNGYWVPMPEILSLLNDQEGPFIWDVLRPLFKGRSVNSACFLIAALLAEGLIQRSEKEPRRYEACDPQPFMAKVHALLAPKLKKKKGGKKEPPTDSPAEPVVSVEETT